MASIPDFNLVPNHDKVDTRASQNRQLSPNASSPNDALRSNFESRDRRSEPATLNPCSPQEDLRPSYYMVEERTQTLGDILRDATTAEHVLNTARRSHGPVDYDVSASNVELDQESARKRSKVSRACDECRRKKTRCDVGSDPEIEPCGPCRRSESSCQFSRQPQKRGPSKGYIKDLSERLNALEHQQAQHYLQQQIERRPPKSGPSNGLTNTTSTNESRTFSPQQTGLQVESRKRTHSRSDYGTLPAESRTNQDIYGRDLPLTGSVTLLPVSDRLNGSHAPSMGYASNGMRQDLGNVDDSVRNSSIERNSKLIPRAYESLAGWDEEVMDEYFRLIHQTFPLLPHSKNRLGEQLNCVSSSLTEAFFTALDVTIRTNPATRLAGCSDYKKQTKRTAELLATSQFEDATTTASLGQSLVYIQTLILMALQADNYGPATLKGLLGPPRGEWLGRAIGAAGNLKLNTMHSTEKLGEGLPDSDERLGRRIWWILFILDRWHSSSTSTLLQVPENSSSLEAQDQIMFGDGMYHLARLSAILGHLTHILQQPGLMASDSKAAPILTLTIVGEVDRFKESVESLLLGAPTLVHLSYWHVRLMVLRLTSSTTPHELLAPAVKLAGVLNSAATVITPLNHHFAALCALTLVELCEFGETQAAARRGIEDIAAALGGRRGLMGRENSTGWDGAIRALVNRKRAQFEVEMRAGRSGGGADACSSNNRRYDPTKLTGSGYLAALVQEET